MGKDNVTTKKGEKTMKGKYLSPKADLTFKLVFAEHKDLMMSIPEKYLSLADYISISNFERQLLESEPQKMMAVLWIRFLKKINENFGKVPHELLENEEISKALSIVEKSAMTDEQLYAYECFWDEVNRTQVLTESHYNKGRAEGRTEGRDERSLEIARNLKGMNLPVSDIAKATGLTADEIEAL